jgi:two-component system OmpR family sensor kinase
VITMALLVVALAVTGWGAQWVLRTYLTGQVDDQIRTTASGLAGDQGRLVAAVNNAGRPVRDDGPLAGEYVLVVVLDSNPAQRFVVYSSGVEGGPQALPSTPPLTSAQAGQRAGSPYTLRGPEDHTRWRAVSYPTSGPVGSGSVTVLLPLDRVDGAITRLQVIIGGFGAAVVLLCGVLGWFAIRRAFRPLAEVEDTAAAIAAGDLSRRIPTRPASTEVGSLTASLNGMLTQIEGAFRAREASEHRTRRFAADASHELRTPLASIRGFAELYRQGAVSGEEEVAHTMRRIEDEAKRMGSLVEDLLLLARLDEQRPAQRDPVDLAVLAGDAVHDARGLDPGRQVTLAGLSASSGPAPTRVLGDEDRLRQVVANLVANAVRHTPHDTPVEIAVGAADGEAVLEVRDRGAGIDPAHTDRLFERFYRVDGSRARSGGGGSGLGLSIVAAVVAAHEGRVNLAPTPGGGATFRVSLPLLAAPEPVDGL